MKKEIGKRISDIRHNMGLSKEQFGKMIGISGQYVGVVESGLHGLSLESIAILCKKAHVSADYVLFGKETITYDELTNLFVGIDEEQIDTTFSTLKNIALLIKGKEA